VWYETLEYHVVAETVRAQLARATTRSHPGGPAVVAGHRGRDRGAVRLEMVHPVKAMSFRGSDRRAR